MRLSVVAAAVIVSTGTCVWAAASPADEAPQTSAVQQLAKAKRDCGAAMQALAEAKADGVPSTAAGRDLLRSKKDEVRRKCGSVGEDLAETGAAYESAGGSGGPDAAGRPGPAGEGGGGGAAGGGALSLPGGGSSASVKARKPNGDTPRTPPGTPASYTPSRYPDPPGGRPSGPGGQPPGTGPAVPGPIAGAGLPALLAGLGLWHVRRLFRRRSHQSAG